MPDRRPTCQIGDKSENNMSDRRPISEPHAPSETDMPDQRPTLGKICIFHEFKKILLLSETHRRPIGDPSETDMPDWRPIRDGHASLENNMHHRRPTCIIGDRHASSETHQRLTCLVRDQLACLETDMSQGRPNKDQHASSETNQRLKCLTGDP